jgi:hypothetical protein
VLSLESMLRYGVGFGVMVDVRSLVCIGRVQGYV